MKSRLKPVDNNKLFKLYKLYTNGEITKTEMSKKLGITLPTLNKRLKEYLALHNTEVVQTEELYAKQKIDKDITASDDAMENSLQIFSNEEFGSIRTVTIDGEPWFVGKDVAVALGYKNTNDALNSHIDSDDKLINSMGSEDATSYILDVKGRKQYPVFINESGLYSLILASKLPSAKKFKRWVTAEVIPSIRKHGAYMTPETLEKAVYNPDFLMGIAKALKSEQDKNKQLTAVNAALIKETNEWDNRSLVTHLIRKYGSHQYNNKFGLAWSEFYRNLNYKLHINVNTRLAAQDNKKKKTLDMIKDNEWSSVLRVAVAMCEDIGINTAKIIEKHCMAL